MDKREQKQAIIAEYLSGGISTRKLGIKYGYAHITISRWLMAHKKYGKSQPLQVSKVIWQADYTTLTDIKELQEALRLASLRVELLEAMIDVSDEEFGTDIRKKAGTRQS